MKRAWIASLNVLVLTCSAMLTSCHYTINNTCPAPCCGNCGAGPGPVTPAKHATPLGKLEPGAMPDLFYVAVDKTGRCPDHRGANGRWVGRPLLPHGTGAQCGYVWLSDSLARPEAELLTRSSLLDRVQPDPPAMGVQQAGEPASGGLDEWFAASYATMRSRLGEPADADRPQQTGNVRVAVVDSAAGDFYHDPQDDVGHGHAVGRLIEDVACKGQTPCRVEIRNYAALPLATSEQGILRVQSPGTGSYGTRGLLAEQIENATQDWTRDRKRGNGPDHLIVNLSLGWSGCWNRKEDKIDDDPVYRAILRASCQGAITVAAGGNIEAILGCPAYSPGAGTVGEHVFPAQFLNHSKRPDAEACRSVGIDVEKDQAIGPLVLGISAVDENDQQLAVADQDSTLVAYGSSVTVPDHPWTRQLSGTSMSAATVSGIAAAVWAAYPARNTRDIERDLIEPAPVLRARPKAVGHFICNALPTSLPQNECEYVRRASLCGSLAHAGGTSGSCGPTPIATNTQATLATNVASSGGECQPGSPECPAPGPSSIDSTEQPWAVVGPQPDGNSCGTCQYAKKTKVFKGIFVAGTVSGSTPGWVHLGSTDYGLWTSAMGSGLSITKTLTATNPSSGTLWYVRNTSAGNIYYYENVTIK